MAADSQIDCKIESYWAGLQDTKVAAFNSRIESALRVTKVVLESAHAEALNEIGDTDPLQCLNSLSISAPVLCAACIVDCSFNSLRAANLKQHDVDLEDAAGSLL